MIDDEKIPFGNKVYTQNNLSFGGGERHRNNAGTALELCKISINTDGENIKAFPISNYLELQSKGDKLDFSDVCRRASKEINVLVHPRLNSNCIRNQP